MNAVITAATADQLAAIIRKARKAGQSSATARWTGGAGKLSLKTLLKLLPELKSVSMTSTAFPLGNRGDTHLKVTFE
ncbi:hypothetical protein GE107_09685 [Cohnella sp. CFH 77786]|uniref:hypothetical protein n=1 Tax=Cohnella sp. CFH 77786 TaxID=2662265 RepID=UPI001C60F5FD|nr:hypothetical protein [Cohnella sp. CFH 77786]MBW5446329.1 hypothetical protein [Cohnella sp. CFH 77786]